jgi:rSAM/selenodomain-associated transferase 1
MAARNHLVIFVKEPKLGQVKTRLARDIGAVAATHFYRRTMARIVRRLARDPRWRTWLAIAPDKAVAARRLWPAGPGRLKQGPGDLGARMDRAFRALPPGPAVIVGSDIPDLQPRHIARAFRALGSADAVFGPAGDGGYWLVGLRRRPHLLDLFADVRWSSAHALGDTLANLVRTPVAFLDTLDDVDDGAAFSRAARSGR